MDEREDGEVAPEVGNRLEINLCHMERVNLVLETSEYPVVAAGNAHSFGREIDIVKCLGLQGGEQ